MPAVSQTNEGYNPAAMTPKKTESSKKVTISSVFGALGDALDFCATDGVQREVINPANAKKLQYAGLLSKGLGVFLQNLIA